MIKRKSETLIYEDAWMSFYCDEIEFSSGERGAYTRIRRKSGAAVVLINSENQIALIKVFRYPAQVESWEIPGGGIEDGQTPRETAKNEVLEELGINIPLKELQPLGGFFPSNSLSNEYQHIFRCAIPHKTLPQHKADDEEIVSAKFVGFSEALQMIKEGQINDALTALAIYLANNDLSFNPK